jgi:hypothetical protein
MSLLNYSTSLVPRAPENVGNLNTMLGEIRASINSIHNEQVNSAAAIDFSKINVPNGAVTNAMLAALSAGKISLAGGQVPVGDGSGGGVARSLSGAISLSAAGAASIPFLYSHTVGAVGIPGAPEGAILGIAIPGGSWLVVGKTTVTNGVSGLASVRLGGGSGTVDSSESTAPNTGPSGLAYHSLMVAGICSEAQLLSGWAAGGGNAWDTVLIGVRLA